MTADVQHSTGMVAEFVADTSFSDVPDGVVETARRAMADAVAAMMSGWRAEPGSVVRGYAGPGISTDGSYWIAAPGAATSDETAALVNATLGHALDYDDSIPGTGHGGVPMLAAALASAPNRDRPLDGRTLVAAFVVGMDVMAAVAGALGVGHTYRGWHMTCTAGTYGATAVASRILGLDRSRTVTALGIAGSLVSGMQRNFGTLVKPLHSGLAARNGVMAAHLAGAGATATTEIFEGAGGLLDVYGTADSGAERFTRLGAPFVLQQPGVALKKYPCCYVAARPIDALIRLRNVEQIRPEQVSAISCRIPVGGMHPMRYPDPADGLQAKFSMEYILAATMIDGSVGLATFDNGAVHRPEVRAMMARTEASEDESLRPDDPSGRLSSPATGGSVVVSIELKDGRTVEETETEPHGGPRRPLAWNDIKAKYDECASFGRFDPDAAERVFTRLRGIELEADALAAIAELKTVPGS